LSSGQDSAVAITAAAGIPGTSPATITKAKINPKILFTIIHPRCIPIIPNKPHICKGKLKEEAEASFSVGVCGFALTANTEILFSRLGISMTDAITMFLTQCELRQGLPFEVRTGTHSDLYK
jgi:hypothetical protein